MLITISTMPIELTSYLQRIDGDTVVTYRRMRHLGDPKPARAASDDTSELIIGMKFLKLLSSQ